LNGEKSPTLDTLEQIGDGLDMPTYKLLVPSERMARKFQSEEQPINDSPASPQGLHSER